MQGNRSSIHVRSIQPRYEVTPDLHWFGDNPFISHLMHALSFLFPPGEEMFVKSVNYYRDQIKDPELRKAVKAFAGQEHLHSKSHHDFNLWIQEKIPEAKRYCESLVKSIDRSYKILEKRKPIMNLAVTVALEHITAIMAATFLNRPETLEKMSPEVRSLFIWHAIEEVEHKSVAFDVYKTVGGSYGLRVFAMIVATFTLSLHTVHNQFRLLWRDGQLTNWRAAGRAFKECFGSAGFFTVLRARYLDFFRRDFHPSQHDDQFLVDAWQEKLRELTPVKVVGRVELA